MYAAIALGSIAAYIFMMFFTGTFIWRRYNDENDGGATIFGGLFWPVAWLIIAGIELGRKVQP